MINTASNHAGYQKLHVWQEAHQLALDTYSITKQFPKDELFALTNQIRRAVVSVAANIVEGQVRASRKEFLQFLFVANGSLVEVEYYFELSKDLGYLSQDRFHRLDERRMAVGNLLHGLMRSLRRL